jgi:hypothetical protein
MRLATIPIVIALSLAPVAGFTADEQGNYAVLGNQSCHAYNVARESENDDQFRFYIMGYLTAFNTIMDETYSISGIRPMGEVMAWFDDYCGSQGIHSFELAIRNFVSESYDDRLQRPPQPGGGGWSN